mgnify:CR=1 FL=1
MLLLYPGGRIRRREVRANLHSTMLLLYPHSESALSLSPRIYIPLCFYFIRSGWWLPVPRGALFTFHYASTLSCIWSRGRLCGPVHLHSTMFLLYPHTCLTVQSLPYKFTFHYASTLSCLTAGLTTMLRYLHSTMLLLYPAIRPNVEGGLSPIYIPLCFYFILLTKLCFSYIFFIYIPLCFYFIGKPRERGLRILPIYIPLCFYFIAYRSKEVVEMYKFTFHYASTLSDTTQYPLRTKCIYIPLCFYFIEFRRRHLGLCYNLHSTMLLLYRSWIQVRAEPNNIYIPLCFYFI